MPSIGVADLCRRLHDQAADALDRADTNGNGSITVAEQRRMDPLLKDFVQAYREGHRGRVRASTFLRSDDAMVAREVAAANLNGDDTLTTREQDRLPDGLRARVAQLLGNVPGPGPVDPPPLAVGPFGINGIIPADRVQLTPLLTRGLDTPTGIAFNPHDGTLWIVNRGDDSSVIVEHPGEANQRAQKFYDDSAHFMNNPMAIAFSRSRNEFATVQDTGNDYNGHAHANMFMGPTLFTADRNVYEGGTNSHLDMVHHSPNAMGIAAGATPRGADHREYWVFNGELGSIDRYFFNEPHELGGHDHHDGETYRYADGELSRVEGVPSHLALDTATGQLYIADTGNGRIAKLNTRASIARAYDIGAHHDETPLKAVPNSHVTTVSDAGLQQPSGLILHGGDLIAGDYATGMIHVFGVDGRAKGSVDTGLGRNTLTGLAEGPDGKLYILDSDRGRLLRLEVLPA